MGKGGIAAINVEIIRVRHDLYLHLIAITGTEYRGTRTRVCPKSVAESLFPRGWLLLYSNGINSLASFDVFCLDLAQIGVLR
jgi:hypothetical protein